MYYLWGDVGSFEVLLYKAVIVPFWRENSFQCANTEFTFSLGIAYDC